MRLSDACEINPRSQAVSDDTLVSFVAMPDVSEDGKINTSIVRPYGEVKKGYTVFQEGDILFAKITPCMENGKGALAVGLQNGIGVGSTEFHVLRPNTNLLDGMWLYYLTAWPAFRHEAEIHMTGSAGQKRVPKTFLERYQLAIPTLDEQKDQVSQLDRIRRIIDSRQRQLRALDTLIKARFVEMFGDPVVNPKGYPIVPISELFDVGSSKRVFESEWREYGVPFYRAREIIKLSQDGFVNNDLFIEEELYEKYKSKYGVPKAGDMMVTGVGTLGVCYIVQPHDRFYFKDGNTLWFKNKGKCSVRFIMEQYGMDFVRRQIEANANVSTVGTYTITNANNTLVLLPPMEEQEKFDAFVFQVDKSKAAIQQALDKAQVLFDSLMQQYFG